MDNEVGNGCSIEKIKKNLNIKTVNGKKYYYLKPIRFIIHTPKFKGKFSKDAYVCPTEISDENLRGKFCLARKKINFEINKFLIKTTTKYITWEYLDEPQIKQLEILRFGYIILLKEFDNSELVRYEEALYTQYVFGTTNIEGNTYTLRETELTLNEGLTVGGKEKREFYEIENYGKLKKYLDTIKSIKINEELIKKIHKIIMENIDDDAAGHFRKVNVGIRGSIFEPVPGIFVEEEINKLIIWYNKNKLKIHPVELASTFHQKFEEIHPFTDGNGRVGRELLRIILKNNGFPTIFIGPKEREEYLKALDTGNSGDLKPINNFTVNNLIKVHKNLIIKSKIELKNSEKEICTKCENINECKKNR